MTQQEQIVITKRYRKAEDETMPKLIGEWADKRKGSAVREVAVMSYICGAPVKDVAGLFTATIILASAETDAKVWASFSGMAAPAILKYLAGKYPDAVAEGRKIAVESNK